MIAGNMSAGLGVDITANVAAQVSVAVTRSTLAGNSADGVRVSTQGAGTATVQISDSMIDGNSMRGVTAIGVGAIAVVCSNKVTRNDGYGLSQSGGGALRTEQDNMVDGNNLGGPQIGGALSILTGI
jgi:hypothetical protein